MKTGKVSEPIKTDKGFSIIKVVSKEDAGLKAYDIEKRKIRQDFLRMRGKDLEKQYFDFLDKLKVDYNAVYFDENIDKVVAAARGDSTDKSPVPRDTT